MISLANKVALVTAAGSGIGRAASKIMAARGACVMVSDIVRDAAEQVAQDIRDAGGEARAVLCDVSEEAQIAAAVAETIRAFGRLDILHNNAAYQAQRIITDDVDIMTMDVDLWDTTMRINLRGAMLGCKHALPHMREQGSGSIVNTSSTYGLSAYITLPAYGVSKAGVAMLTQYVATAHGKQGVRCNAVAPALILTPATDRMIPAELIRINEDGALTPFLGTPEDVGATVAFLASDDARFITGQTIAVDGGTMAHLPTVAAARAYHAGGSAETRHR